jgi:hypothetical protein
MLFTHDNCIGAMSNMLAKDIAAALAKIGDTVTDVTNFTCVAGLRIENWLEPA